MISIDRRDLAFQLFDVLDAERLQGTARYAEYDRQTIEAVLDSAEHIAIHHFLPHAALLDRNEPRFVDGRVSMDESVGKALAVFREAGFFGAGFDHEWGGAQMPEVCAAPARSCSRPQT